MARRPDPERIHLARRIATRNRLMRDGMTLEDAEHWCDLWQTEGDRLGIPRDRDYWISGEAWIIVRRRDARQD